METIWFVSRVVDGTLSLSSKQKNACLVRDTDSLAWAKELLQLYTRYECDSVTIDLSGIEYVSFVAIQALQSVAASLAVRSGRLLIGGVRPHVLAIFLAIAPRLGATNDPVASTMVRTALAA